jgi:choline dehydrogenase-like flavoprotein
MIPNEQSFCEIDPLVKDKWGIPVLRFHWKWSDHELNQVRHMQTTFRQILEAMGGTINVPGGGRGRGAGPQAPPSNPMAGSGAAMGPTSGPANADVPISVGGGIIHEVGTVRMGDDPKSSVLNRFCQSHDVRNLFVADGAPFVSNPDKNPTHTIIALAWRTAEYLAEEMRKGNV